MHTYSGPGPADWPAMTSIPPKPRMRKIGDLWHAMVKDAEGFCGAFSNDAHEAYAECMRMAGWKVFPAPRKAAPPIVVDIDFVWDGVPLKMLSQENQAALQERLSGVIDDGAIKGLTL